MGREVGVGVMEPLPTVFDMLQYFGTIVPSIENLWPSQQDEVQSNLSLRTLLYYGQFVWFQKCPKSYIPYLYNTDTSVKREIGSVPLVFVLKRFDCIFYGGVALLEVCDVTNNDRHLGRHLVFYQELEVRLKPQEIQA